MILMTEQLGSPRTIWTRVPRYRKSGQELSSGADLHSEFDFRVLGDGRSASARYANNSNYRNDSLIRKESMQIGVSIYSVTDNSSVRERCIGR